MPGAMPSFTLVRIAGEDLDAPDLSGGSFPSSSQPAFGPRAMHDLSPYSVKGDVHRSPTAGPNGTRNRSGQPRSSAASSRNFEVAL